MIKICLFCKKEYKVYPYRSKIAQFCSNSCKLKCQWQNPNFRQQRINRMLAKTPWNKGKKFPQFCGENSPSWNENIGYHGLHIWLVKTFGNPLKCESCGEIGYKSIKNRWNIEWALVKGKKYERMRENFWGLCIRCHRNYDFTEEHRKNLSKSHKGQKSWNKGMTFKKIAALNNELPPEKGRRVI